MPLYSYKCASCGYKAVFEHGYNEDGPTQCSECLQEKTLFRDFNSKFSVFRKSTVGDTVRKFIEETKEQIREEKAKLK